MHDASIGSNRQPIRLRGARTPREERLSDPDLVALHAENRQGDIRADHDFFTDAASHDSHRRSRRCSQGPFRPDR